MEKQAAQKFSSLQQNMDIVDIKKGVIVLKDGSLRAVAAVSSINFDLKSQEEQEAIVASFQGFLNTIEYPIQIMISSKRFDVDPYLKSLEQKRKREENTLLKNQIGDYMDFVKELTTVTNIMSTRFYIIVPFYTIEVKQKGIFDKISTSVNPRKAIYQKRESFETSKNQLYQRISQIEGGLSGIGLRVAVLKTEELIELFYNFYNPSEFEYNTMENLGQINMEN